ncbi:hypothetical protein ACWEOE_13520 [Amycolatopsis sp. NPDC004368]
MDISANTIFIPGSTSGIGLAPALELRARGNTVIIGGRRTGRLREIVAQHPSLDTGQIDTGQIDTGQIDTGQIDTADPASITATA